MLVPLNQLPLSANTKNTQARFSGRPHPPLPEPMSIPIGAVLEISDVEASVQYEDGVSLHSPRSRTINRTIMAFTLIKNVAPVVGKSWIDFVDDELQEAEMGRSSMGAIYEGQLPMIPVKVDQDAVDLVQRFLTLSADITPKCDIAIERLNLARRRHSAGNRAIEAGICLEALLGDNDDKGEITYKLRLRTALLLGSNLKQRKDIAATVRDLYNLRSKTVHGNLAKEKNRGKDDEMASKGLDVCAEVLRKIVELNRKFEPADWELSGGTPVEALSDDDSGASS